MLFCRCCGLEGVVVVLSSEPAGPESHGMLYTPIKYRVEEK